MRRSSGWSCPRARPPTRATAPAPSCRCPPSLVREARLALAEERGDALAEVARARGQDLVAILHRDHLLEAAGVERVLQALLGELQTERRIAQHARGELARG